MIRRLRVRAFKGLREFSIDPDRVNLLIGANGTGKTNFADLVSFISLLPVLGLPATVDKFDGLDQVRTRQPRAGRPYRLEIEIHLGPDRSRGIQEARYLFSLAQSGDLRVQKEELEAVVYKRKPGKPARQGVPRFDVEQPIRLAFRREGTDITDWSEALGPRLEEFDNDRELILATYGRLGELRTFSNYLSSWRVYNIDAAIAKQASGSADSDLERYGNNIVPYVARVLKDRELRERLLLDIREAVPYIRDIQSDRVLSYQTLRFLEEDSGSEFQLAQMSDGTIRLLGLLTILRQPVPPAVVVIEEPENALHMHAVHSFLQVARRVAMADDFASQVFMTSHSPAVVDEMLSLDAMRETDGRTACFVTQRKSGQPNIVQAPASVMKAIAENLGRPSDFQREGSFGDEPTQLPLTLNEAEAA